MAYPERDRPACSGAGIDRGVSMVHVRPRGRVLIIVLALVAAVIAPLGGGADRAAAVTAADWDPGNIISDANFYNGSAMSEAEIQQFLVGMVGSCQNANCLAAYRADTPTRTWSFGTCSTYPGGAAESAARIIFKVQQACNLSAKVILVTLQKEQGLLTDRAPSDGVMRKAMGYGCPDTASCDSTYYGFFNQVFAAGRQLTWYGNPAGSFTSIRVGSYNAIQYHPNSGCGTRDVLVRNRATAALYYYTPYTPNSAALANLTGTGDGCSAYGNRNFWVFYNNWFGPASGPDGRAFIAAEYGAQGGVTGALGPAISDVITIPENGGGLGQAFSGGSIYWSAGTGALTVYESPLRQAYFRHGGAAGAVGWPVLNQQSVAANGGGIAQLFTGGSIFSSAAGGFVVSGQLRNGYFSQNGALGALGWPKADAVCGLAGGACTQAFQGGTVYSTSGGTHALFGSIDTAYRASGGVDSAWGVPDSGMIRIGDGFGAAFRQASAYSLGSGPAYGVDGAIRQLYFEHGGATGRFGFPTSEKSCDLPGGECGQAFQYGSIIASAVGVARIASPEIEAAHARNGGTSGVLGAVASQLTYYPYGGGGLAQAFAGGSVFFKPAHGAFAVTGEFRADYFAGGGAAGAFGWPRSDVVCGTPGGSCAQTFEGATVYWTESTGAHGVSGAMLSAYDAAGGAGGGWGWPVSSRLQVGDRGAGQVFTNGSGFALDQGSAHLVSGPIRDAYFGTGGAVGRFGFPTSDATCDQGACVQTFEGGTARSDASGAVTLG